LPLFLCLAASSGLSCGKRADPLAPYVKTPQAPGGLEAAQVGEEVEIRVTAPRMTTEGRPLPVIELEWLQAPAEGAFGKVAISLLREEAAPGEIRIKRFKRPSSEARFSVRAFAGKAQSAPVAPLPFKPAAVPPTPTSLQATNTVTGVELRWTNPPGAEPWPQPTPNPSPLTSPPPVGAAPNPGESKTLAQPATGPSPSTGAEPSTAEPTAPDAGKPVSAPDSTRPGGSPSPSPKSQAPLALPTGIRIFRTDGAPRLAREPLQASSWLDTGSKPGERPCYSLRYTTSFTPLVESAATESVCVDVKDIVPPEPPGRLVGDLSATFVELSWVGSPSVDVAFYRIYRSTETEARSMVIETPGPLLRVRDTNMTPGPRTYEIMAVDKGGNESPPGPPLKITVP
jgi:hypothetical protein